VEVANGVPMTLILLVPLSMTDSSACSEGSNELLAILDPFHPRSVVAVLQHFVSSFSW